MSQSLSLNQFINLFLHTPTLFSKVMLLRRHSPSTKLSVPVGMAALLFLVNGAIAAPPPPASPGSTVTAQIPANARVVYVNPTLGTDGPSAGSESAPFRTISYAMQQVQPNTVIQLAPGSYTRDTGEVFPIVVRPNVILRGDESTKGQTVLIIGSGSYASPSFAVQNVTIRAESDSSIRGVTVTNPNSRGTAIWVESTNPSIRDSTLSNSLRDGIFVTGTAAPTIEGNVFTGNQGNGVSVARTAQGEIRGNIFQNTGFGIAIGGDSAPRVEGNQVVQNVDGIVVSNNARPVLRNNVIESNTRDGVVAIANAQPDLGNAESSGENLIRNNGRYDLYNATRSNTILAVGNQIDPAQISGLVDFVATTVAGASRFPDVTGHWAAAYIEALAERNVIGGFPDGTYRPNEPVTRAQFAAIVNAAFSPTPERSGITFPDVRSDFWGNAAIQSAYRGNFLSGYPDATFRPNQQIPRVQALVSLASGLKLPAGDTTALTRYQDAAQIPGYAAGAIAATTQRGIVVNYPNVQQLNPNQVATRADVAAFIYQALVNAGQAEAIPSPYLVLSSSPSPLQ
jgi:parallel beta-helix repeat protein